MKGWGLIIGVGGLCIVFPPLLLVGLVLWSMGWFDKEEDYIDKTD